MGSRLQGKVALITGATSGIGQAAAVLFAEEGAKVVVAGRREDRGANVVREVEAVGGQAIFVKADVSKAEDCENMVAKTVAAFGRLDVAFNNAGLDQPWNSLENISYELWNEIIAVNLSSVFYSMKAQIPEILKAGGGAIVNTSSVAGLVGLQNAAAYSSAKWGLIGLTKSTALDLAKRKIRVNAICPGGVESEMLAKHSKDPVVKERLLKAHPVRRFASTREAATTALFLLSDDSSFVTGQALAVDGGLSVE